MPRRSGTTDCPVVMVSVIRVPTATSWSAGGFTETTVLGSAVMSSDAAGAEVTFVKPASASRCLAASNVRPSRSVGIFCFCGPMLTVRVTGESSGTSTPPCGSVFVTVPTVLLSGPFTVVTTGRSLAWRTFASAAACCWPTRPAGTVTIVGPGGSRGQKTVASATTAISSSPMPMVQARVWRLRGGSSTAAGVMLPVASVPPMVAAEPSDSTCVVAAAAAGATKGGTGGGRVARTRWPPRMRPMSSRISPAVW